VARQQGRLTKLGRDLLADKAFSANEPFLLNLGINKEGAFASAMTRLTGGDNWEFGIEGGIEKPFDSAMDWEITSFVRGSW